MEASEAQTVIRVSQKGLKFARENKNWRLLINHAIESQKAWHSFCVLDSEHRRVLKNFGKIRNPLSPLTVSHPCRLSVFSQPCCNNREVPFLSPRNHLHFGCGSCQAQLPAGNSSGPGAGILAAGRETDNHPWN